MEINSLRAFIEKTWERSVMPSLIEYVTIPAVSPAFHPEWENSAYLLQTLELAKKFCDTMKLDNAATRIITRKGRTPILLMEINPTPADNPRTVLLYGHLDKQPPATGWDSNKGPWTPVVENDRLYGRGSADDGYSIYSAVTAVKALQECGLSHPKIVILIETCEESGSWDLAHYLEECKDQIGRPDLVICLDSGCGDYERLWVTTSLRGSIVGTIDVKLLTQDIHSGASGMVASSFRVMRQILDRIEDARTGAVLIEDLYCPIPDIRKQQIRQAATVIDKGVITSLPLFGTAQPVSSDPEELIINSTWKPAISYTGADGIPPIRSAGNALRHSTRLLLSIRTPPLIDTELPAQLLKNRIEADPPYGAGVTFDIIKHSRGWDMPAPGHRLEKAFENAAADCFGNPVCFTGEGGSIPFMNLLSQKFPDARFLITGVLGPQSNAHGPNEFLHLPYAKKLTLAVSAIISRF